MMKAYRLINSSERARIQECVDKLFQEWNHEYSVHPIHIKLHRVPKQDVFGSGILVHEEDRPLAFANEHVLRILNRALFKENKSCFDACSLELFHRLLKSLFQLEQCPIATRTQSAPHWFYPGTTALLASLALDDAEHIAGIEEAQHHAMLMISPDWVSQLIPLKQSSNQHLSSIEHALAPQKLDLNVALLPIALSLNQVLKLQIGNVLTTEHPISKPLELLQKEQLVAHADLGQSGQYKSIILKRSS